VPALDFLQDELQALESRGLLRKIRDVRGRQGPVLEVDGDRVVSFSSNDYLGLAGAGVVVEAAERALGEEGFGAGASRLIVGSLQSHRRLEERLAAFHERPAALLFNSGYQANVGVLSALAGPEDVIFSDALNHASLIDGCRLSRARVEVYGHCDVAAVARKLESSRGRRRFVVTDAVFSMDGDIAPVADLRAVCDRYDAVLIVDEAHGVGVLGPAGRGVCAAQHVLADVHVGTLGKAFGAFGAYVVGSRELTTLLMNKARSFVFSTALPPSVPAAAEAALSLLRSPEGDARRSKLAALTLRLAAGLRALGLPTPPAPQTPILPVILGDAARAMAASQRLLELHVFVQGIRPPTVPAGTSRLRFSLSAAHEPAHVDQALDALATLAAEDFFKR